MTDKKLLEKNGWITECESPFEIRHIETGSFATGLAAYAVLRELESEEDEETLSDFAKVINHLMMDIPYKDFSEELNELHTHLQRDINSDSVDRTIFHMIYSSLGLEETYSDSTGNFEIVSDLIVKYLNNNNND